MIPLLRKFRRQKICNNYEGKTNSGGQKVDVCQATESSGNGCCKEQKCILPKWPFCYKNVKKWQVEWSRWYYWWTPDKGRRKAKKRSGSFIYSLLGEGESNLWLLLNFILLLKKADKQNIQYNSPINLLSVLYKCFIRRTF